MVVVTVMWHIKYNKSSASAEIGDRGSRGKAKLTFLLIHDC